MRADGVRVHLSTSAPLRTQAVFLFSFLEKPMTYAGLRVAPHDSCYDHYDGYLSLCVMRSPPLCFVGRAVQQQLPLGFIVEQSCNDKREKKWLLLLWPRASLKKKIWTRRLWKTSLNPIRKPGLLRGGHSKLYQLSYHGFKYLTYYGTFQP